MNALASAWRLPTPTDFAFPRMRRLACETRPAIFANDAGGQSDRGSTPPVTVTAEAGPAIKVSDDGEALATGAAASEDARASADVVSRPGYLAFRSGAYTAPRHLRNRA